jgi:hypothetical protein
MPYRVIQSYFDRISNGSTITVQSSARTVTDADGTVHAFTGIEYVRDEDGNDKPGQFKISFDGYHHMSNTQNSIVIEEITDGGRKRPSPKATKKHVLINGQKRVIYEGPKGGKYIKRKGEYVTLSKAKH